MRERMAQVKQKAEAARDRVQQHNAAARQPAPQSGTPDGGPR